MLQYNRSFASPGITDIAFWVIATTAAKNFGWKLTHIAYNYQLIYAVNTSNGNHQNITIHLKNQTVTIEIKSIGRTLQVGADGMVASMFEHAFLKLQQTLTHEQIERKREEYENNIAETGIEANNVQHTHIGTKVLALFVPRKDYIFTPIITYLVVFIFLCMLLAEKNIWHFSDSSMVNWGANLAIRTQNGSWSRLITNTYIHRNFISLLLNLSAFISIGKVLEPFLGKARFFIAFFLSAFVASLMSIWFDNLSIFAGASSGIFGLYGLFFMLVSYKLVPSKSRLLFFVSFAAYTTLYIIIGITTQNLDITGCISGCIFGILVGFAYLPALRQDDDEKLRMTANVTLSIIVPTLVIILLQSIPNDFKKYTETMEKYNSMELTASNAYYINMDDRRTTLNVLSREGIYNWQECLILLKAIDKLSLYPETHVYNDKLKKHCELQTELFEMAYKMVREETHTYDGEIAKYNQLILKVQDDIEKSNPLRTF